MAIYFEAKYYVRTSANCMWREIDEPRTLKHEVSQSAYDFYVGECLKDVKPIKHKDGSVSYYRQLNYNEMLEEIITIT